MPKKNKTVKELNVELEFLTDRVRMLEDRAGLENMETNDKKFKGIEDILKTYDDKIKDLDELLRQGKAREIGEKIEKLPNFKCKDCGEHFKKKIDLKLHRQNNHPKVYI